MSPSVPFVERSLPSLSGALSLILIVSLMGSVPGCGTDVTEAEDFANDNVGESNQGENQNQTENQNQGENQSQAENQDTNLPPADTPDIIVGIDTVVSTTSVVAGESVSVDCVFLNPDDEPVDIGELEEPPNDRLLLYPDDGIEQEGDAVVPTQAGEVTVACQSTDLGLTDLDPARIAVEPADIHTTVTTLDDHQIVAGGQVAASCEAYDIYGNPVHDASFSLVADTSSSGIVIDDENLTVSLTSAGLFTFNCHVSGTMESFGDAVEVVPDRPAELLADPSPNQDVYAIGQIISIDTDVRDQFGNRIHYPQLEFGAQPGGESFGDGRFRFHSDGIYTLSAEVVEPTHNDTTLYEEFEIVVNETGPDINCSFPFDGEMIDTTPGDSISFEGTVADEHGVESVEVNGEAVTINSHGDFATSITTRYGINFVDVVATDDHGEENVRTCAFLVSDGWSQEDDYLDNAVSLSLFQDAIDDKNFGGANDIRSLNDLLMTVLNSEGLRAQIEQEVMDGNPYPVNEAGCTFNIYVTALRFTDSNGHETALDLIGGGLRLHQGEGSNAGMFSTIEIDLNIDGSGGFWCISGSPTMTIDWLDIDLYSDMGLSGGTPSLTLSSIDVTSGEVSLSGGWGIISFFFQGTFRGIVEDIFEDAVSDNFDELIGGLLASLDVETLGGSFDVPRLDSDDTMALDFGFMFSHVNANTSRALFGLAPEIIPGDGAGHAISSLGVAHPPGAMLNDPSGNSAAAAAHVALLNQAMHSLWRGGLFHADVGGALGEDIPEGASVELETRLPPVVVLHAEGQAEVMLGAIRLELVYPGIFDEPVSFMLGATADTTISLDNQEIDFGNIQMNEFHLSPQEVSINEGTRDVLEDFIGGLMETIIDQSLNAALPALPIPTFTIPASMGDYDLTPGSELGLYNTSLDQTIRHLELHGEFGIE